MFEDGARIDDILNVLKRPTLDAEEDKKDNRNSEAAIRYDFKRSPSDEMIKFEFAKQMNSGVLR